ncbi:ran-binding protein 3-like isoform X1 [Fukomys damarensis]|uniref:ran-binding protein 3-like isoform X1 n=1 Tax=Fukomys damarensis TaxID=885580 RepID=UPI00053F7166|nr:ran-binding protein 3-like isoform X1 [Fukomys damarensis]XP_010603778.1 ran-binding protein 3-like isoform X1 [Fukomys damarensis]XP_010603779.1 ran-binding protein 3-like isoform X1 [Fukomys damarensis]
MSATQRKGSSHLFTSLHMCHLKLQENQQQQEKSVIAQPTFIFEKGEQTFKRPVEDILHEAEHECNGFSRKRVRSSSFTLHHTDSGFRRVSALSQKRLRSSSFTDLPTFPPSGPVKKTNVFMTSTLIQKNVDMNSAEQGPIKHSECVLRPAVLQPPQAQSCENVRKTFWHNASESCKIKEKTNHTISVANCNLLSETLPTSRISVQHFLGATLLGCQPNEDKCSSKSCSSDFVFGENMVERVLGPAKVTQPQPENDTDVKETTFKSILKFPINSPNSRTESIKSASLIESAAAFSSQPLQKCLLEKIDVITGEEAEHNVLKINCKLFIFNKATQSWIERGRGTLRLNDTASSDCGTLQSRLIMRNQGSLRLILNSKLWAQMKIQRVNHKNLRITATDLEDYCIKVFLIQAGPKDARYLYAAIHHRLVALRSFSNKQKDINQAESQSETVLQQLNCESCDEDEDDFIQVTKNVSDPSRWTHRQSVACS